MQAACLPTYGTLSQADNDNTDSAGPHKERMLQRLAPSLGLSRHSDILRKQWPDKVVDTVQWPEYHGAECLLLWSLVDRVPRCRVLTSVITSGQSTAVQSAYNLLLSSLVDRVPRCQGQQLPRPALTSHTHTPSTVLPAGYWLLAASSAMRNEKLKLPNNCRNRYLSIFVTNIQYCVIVLQSDM